jgi:signal transduction histidine kinase
MKHRLRPAFRVAIVATGAAVALYVVIVAGILLLVSHRLVSETDARLSSQLHGAASQPNLSTLSAAHPRDGDEDDAPIYLWHISSAGKLSRGSSDAPPLPSSVLRGDVRFPRSESFGGSGFRVDSLMLDDGSRLVAAESLAQEHHVKNLILVDALLVSPLVVAGVFGSAFLIGRQASKPIEHARVKQLEFTGNASHELRTPLTVIEAEVGLALNANRSAEGYRESLERISGETHRLRRIVEDLLWLARFDSEPPPPHAELVDVATVAQLCADRFDAVLRARDIKLDFSTPADEPALIAAPPEWVDRLTGVLLDNAIRYASSPGRIMVRVSSTDGRVALTVDDDGPGIPFEERARLFDRFHRLAESSGEGAGLGLAIADAVVRSTHGHWTIADSQLGGASITVSWRSPRMPTS